MRYEQPKIIIKTFTARLEAADLSNGINMTQQALENKNITNIETSSLSDFTVIQKAKSLKY